MVTVKRKRLHDRHGNASPFGGSLPAASDRLQVIENGWVSPLGSVALEVEWRASGPFDILSSWREEGLRDR